MPGPIRSYLTSAHDRLNGLLERSIRQPGVVGRAAYDEFRSGLLRHIGMEENILLPFARKARGGDPLPAAGQLKRDHAALAALLVPTPTPAIIKTIQIILLEHNPLEEGPDGIYGACECLAGNDAAAIAARIESAPEARVARHYDTPLIQEHIDRLLALRHSDANE